MFQFNVTHLIYRKHSLCSDPNENTDLMVAWVWGGLAFFDFFFLFQIQTGRCAQYLYELGCPELKYRGYCSFISSLQYNLYSVSLDN